MIRTFSQDSCDIRDYRERLSVMMQLQALFMLVWPRTYAKFEREWHKASSITAKGYATPRFVQVSAEWVPIDLVLEKNSDENEDYLEILRVDASRLEQTRYVQEVQIKKHGRSLASTLVRVEEFRNLAESVARDGIRRPVLLADVAAFELPYRMYRFDGHHRAICAKHLGLERVPAFVFTVTPPESPTLQKSGVTVADSEPTTALTDTR
jgi:hypothetical protein